MIRIKNLQPCRLIITDAGIKLLPGQVVSVASLSPQTENLIAMGHVAKLEEQTADTGGQASGVTANNSPTVTVPKEYENLSVQEAIQYINGQTDPQILRAILKEEKRNNLLEAINRRLSEIEK